MSEEPGKQFRDAWIAGVHRHYPGEPKPGYVIPWEDTPAWERACAAATEGLVHALLRSSDYAAVKLTRVQKGQFVAAIWNAQIYRHVADPKPSYVAPWENLPPWQREVDADIFEALAGRSEQDD